MGKYLYCIIKERAAKRFDKAHTINQGNLAVVASDTKSKTFPFGRESLIFHQKVIEEVMRRGYDVLPMRFGIIAKSAEDVREKILKARRKEFLEAFKKTQGKVELGLKALWRNMPSIFQEIVTQNPKIQKAKKEAQKNPNQFKIAAVGELVGKALEQKRERGTQKILNRLKKLAVDFKERNLVGESMIFSSAFLVAKKKEKEFDKMVLALAEEYQDRIKFIYVGPIPPYNFINLCF